MDVRSVTVDEARLEVRDWGAGEPVVFVQTALTADELLPLAREAALDAGYRKVVYHRRGYGGSSAAEGAASIVRDADDCIRLLEALGIERAHVVGVSFSAAIALQLAADAPDRTHTLTLVEPPPTHTTRRADFRAANEQLLRVRRERGVEAALEEFGALLEGPQWRQILEADLPGAVAQIERDAATFFDNDLPALLSWRFGATDARRIRRPVLYVAGAVSGPLFAEVGEVVRRWLPHAENVVIDGAGHSLVLTHPAQTAAVLVDFLRRHPM